MSGWRRAREAELSHDWSTLLQLAEKRQVTNLADANKLLRREYRDGFEVKGL